MRTLKVDFGPRSYPVYIGSDILSASLLSQYTLNNQFVIVTNVTVAALYLPQLLIDLADYQVDVIKLADGESWKTLETVSEIMDQLMLKRYDRQTTLIALGGGVVGDITGFVASCYRRGIHFIQIPTTLLAQVDASIGGKTGVNHALGKNMIGTFYQPNCVISDLKWLDTLPDREYFSGLAEIIKYGLIGDSEFYQWLKEHIKPLVNREKSILLEAIYKSCQYKSSVVALDECDKEVREILNFGHTIGHAIETTTHYKMFLHGEAVSIGMVLAMDLSIELNQVPSQALLDLKSLLKAANLPTELPINIKKNDLLSTLFQDKKVLKNQLRFVLLTQIGQAMIMPVSESKVDQVLSRYVLH